MRMRPNTAWTLYCLVRAVHHYLKNDGGLVVPDLEYHSTFRLPISVQRQWWSSHGKATLLYFNIALYLCASSDEQQSIPSQLHKQPDQVRNARHKSLNASLELCIVLTA